MAAGEATDTLRFGAKMPFAGKSVPGGHTRAGEAASQPSEVPKEDLRLNRQTRCASHLSHPGCIKNADRSAGTGDGTIFAVRRA